MLKDTGSSAALKSYFKKNKLAKLVDLFQLLNTKSRMTVLRRLRKIQYLTSYTHAGSYYTLKSIPDFDSSNLWYFNDVGFSKFGSLKETVVHLIVNSDSGRTHEELENKLHIRVHNTLLDLINSDKIKRIKIKGEFIYFSILPSISKKQLSNRKNYSQRLKRSGLSDGVIIEILASIIRTSKGVYIDSAAVALDLSLRGIAIENDQIDAVLIKFDLKKTLDYL